MVALGVSYAIPPAINCLRGRKMLPPRPFVLPGPLGWMCNLLGIAYVIVTTVLFLFPPTLPVTGSNMSTSSVSPLHLHSIHHHRPQQSFFLRFASQALQHNELFLLPSHTSPSPLPNPLTSPPTPSHLTNETQKSKQQTTASSPSSSSSS